MRDGLYKVQFKTPLGDGAGVAYLAGGKMHGGDSMIFYVGTYAEDGGQFTASVQTDAHSSVPSMASVFGVSKASINLKGTSEGDKATMQGSSPQAPGVSFSATLTRIAD
ncbi:hypothetical protein ASD21_07185 [Caulobacter sp. Root1455]|uniref:GrlR family regulatory protein n=1 Tax=Caulobacter sp. Root1455 TaxID=1736465 RepID=UPI0006F90311|nr:GrlR family regulatory protein [Caulobacter sp. Root1455]KQY95142.1 hypothetical protein ASD21_07185 [Caulobacter sp. Root1455]